MEGEFISVDGKIVPAGQSPEGPYIRQTVHCIGGRPLHTKLHAEILCRDAQAAFGLGGNTDCGELDRNICQLLAANNAPQRVSSFVKVIITPSGKTILTYDSVSLYSGYALRSLRPAASTVTYDLPMPKCRTSAEEAAAAVARLGAQRTGAQISIHCTIDGLIVDAECAPLFALKGGTAYTSPSEQSVERMLAIRIIEAAGLEIITQPIGTVQLSLFDELFAFDHKGITSIASCDGNPYMSIVTERIARQLHTLISK